MGKTVVIDCFPESAKKYRSGYAIVAVDVIRATTSAITAAARGGRCFPVSSIESAYRLKHELGNPLLAGEVDGEIALGFEITNSPAELDSRYLVGRPVILLSSSGTQLIKHAAGSEIVHLACFRNYGSIARYLAADAYPRVAVIGAGSRGEFREEDQMCCAWVARGLVESGYVPGNRWTADLIDRWCREGPESARSSKSADYLRRSGQTRDLEFILSHINDLCSAYVMQGDELIVVSSSEAGVAVAGNSTSHAVPETNSAC